jgi:hypothetical protein
LLLFCLFSLDRGRATKCVPDLKNLLTFYFEISIVGIKKEGI